MNTEPRNPPTEDQARQFLAAVEEAMLTPTSYRDDTPLPVTGTAPPVAQPGTPPMSQRATDVSRVMIAAGLATAPPGLIAIGIMVASEHANPTVIGMICAAPAVLAVPILAIARLVKRAGEAVPAEQHHHYNGPVHVHQDQRNVRSKSVGVWVKNSNQP